MSRGQIALWMLTKFAMVFFIFALALLMTTFANREKAALCELEAERVAISVSSLVQQVLTSPSEDERKVYVLPSSLSIGSGDYAVYELKITLKEVGGVDTLLVSVDAANAKCSAGRRIPLTEKIAENNDGVEFSAQGSVSNIVTSPDYQITFEPSIGQDRSAYMILIKCRQKIDIFAGGTLDVKQFLFVQDCRDSGFSAVNPDSCLSFDSAELQDRCNWG
ncbi:MAG: hypothetical protein V1834_00370 [Candidatus Micrarchaeota archaeon]